MIEVACLGCGKLLKAKDELAGKRVKCPKCGGIIRLPGSSEEPTTDGGVTVSDATAAVGRAFGAAASVTGSAFKKLSGLIPNRQSSHDAVPSDSPQSMPENSATATQRLSLVQRLTAEQQDPTVVAAIVDRVQQILSSSEEILYVAVQQKPVINWFPDSVVLTTRRVILYRPKMLGRVDFQDFIWRDLRDVHLSENIIGSTITLKTVKGQSIALDYLPKAQSRVAYRIAQEREEEVFEERRTRDMEEKRAAAGGVFIQNQVPTMPSTPSTPVASQNVDPFQKLQQLKQMLDAGLIEAAEFDRKKSEILASM